MKIRSTLLPTVVGFITFFALVAPLPAQMRIETNESRSGNLAGKKIADTWSFEVKEDESDLHFEVLTEAGRLAVSVIPFGQKKPIKIQPVGGKGNASGVNTIVIGQRIEATQIAGFKLPRGKYQVQIKPYLDHPGSYSLKIMEPTLGRELGSAPATATPSPAPNQSQSAEDPRIQELLRRVEELEKRVEVLEGLENGESGS